MEVSGGVACIGTHHGSALNKPSNEVIYRTMALFFSSCWFIITNSFIWLFNFIATHLLRFRKGNSSQVHALKASLIDDSRRVESCPEFNDSYTRDYDSEEEAESPTLSFKFQYQFSGHHKFREEEQLQPVAEENKSSVNTSIHKYCFVSEKDFSGFIGEPEAKTCRIQESYVAPSIFSSYDNKDISTKLNTASKDCHLPSIKAANHDTVVHTGDKLAGIRVEEFPNVEPLEQEKLMSSEPNLSGELKTTGPPKFLSEEFSVFDSGTESLSSSDGYSVKDLVVDSDSDCLFSEYELETRTLEAAIHATRDEVNLLEDIRRLEEAQAQFVAHDYHTESDSAMGKFSLIKKERGYTNIKLDEHLPENESDCSDPGQKGEAESNQVQNFDESKVPTSSALQMEYADSGDDELRAAEKHSSIRKSSDDVLSSDDLVKPDGTHMDLDERESGNDADIDSIDSHDSITSTDSEFSSGFDGSHDGTFGQVPSMEYGDSHLMAELDELAREEELERKGKAPNESKQEEEASLEDLDDEDYDELESLWEHQDLIEQLKMELKRVRAIGLPTIKEESEIPKTVDDLKPWNINEKFLHEDPMDELHKFYKSYRERMRKFDILNYQKMYAIGLLQLQDPLQSMGGSQKSLIPTITSILSQSFLPCTRKSGINPSEKFIKELQNDLEMVYAGQTCLSWEFLRWQYEKVRQLPESDPYRDHHYNQVAGEFQQFQVILQRFIEDEAFQGPRLHNFVKNRCAAQNLLLVPVIREDSFKEKMEDQRKGNYIITSEILEDVMEESIRIFWEFVKADKDETPGILKGLMGPRVELQDPADFEFMSDIQSNLQKKERKLKDIVRTGNCLVKKFKKPKEDRSNQDLFFSQVDLKLVARVLRMSRITTDQLVWCHAKLSNITFLDRKVYREPSFLLFPC